MCKMPDITKQATSSVGAALPGRLTKESERRRTHRCPSDFGDLRSEDDAGFGSSLLRYDHEVDT